MESHNYQLITPGDIRALFLIRQQKFLSLFFPPSEKVMIQISKLQIRQQLLLLQEKLLAEMILYNSPRSNNL